MAELKKDPNFKPASLELNKEYVITLSSAKPLATGNSKFGAWHLWKINVENTPVTSRDTNEEIKDYTGVATWFPTEEVHTELLAATKGTQENVKILFKVTAEKGEKGLYYKHNVVVAEEGKTPPSNLSHDGHRFLEKYNKFIETYKTLVGHNILVDSKENFIKFATSQTNNIPAQEAETLWNVYNEK
jgi:hypothetical protein